MPRAFIAIDFPESTANQLQDIAFGLPSAVWVPAHQYHLTLRFLKDIEEEVFEDVRHALNEVRSESFHLSLRNVGHFPLRGTPEILWAGVVQNEALLRLNHKLESALKRAGIDPDGRKFHPHVTLARLKMDPCGISGISKCSTPCSRVPIFPWKSSICIPAVSRRKVPCTPSNQATPWRECCKVLVPRWKRGRVLKSSNGENRIPVKPTARQKRSLNPIV